jgi:hypothetical protein
MAAAFEGHTAVGKLLLASKGIDVNACNEDPQNPKTPWLCKNVMCSEKAVLCQQYIFVS